MNKISQIDFSKRQNIFDSLAEYGQGVSIVIRKGTLVWVCADSLIGDENSHFLLAVSGGVDSMVLLDKNDSQASSQFSIYFVPSIYPRIFKYFFNLFYILLRIALCGVYLLFNCFM